jgi:hypothetical protein
MENIFKVAKYQKTDTGFTHMGYDEYVITFCKSKKVHLLRIVVNGQFTEHTINLVDTNSGYKKTILTAISDYKNNRLKGDPTQIVKKIITFSEIVQIYSKPIVSNVKNYLLGINKEERRDTLTKFELI